MFQFWFVLLGMNYFVQTLTSSYISSFLLFNLLICKTAINYHEMGLIISLKLIITLKRVFRYKIILADSINPANALSYLPIFSTYTRSLVSTHLSSLKRFYNYRSQKGHTQENTSILVTILHRQYIFSVTSVKTVLLLSKIGTTP